MNKLSISIPDWIPIEEAPKDGTVVDLYITHSRGGFRETDCWWRPDVQAWTQASKFGTPHFIEFKDPNVKITHFRYEPASPGQPNPYKEAIRLMVERLEQVNAVYEKYAHIATVLNDPSSDLPDFKDAEREYDRAILELWDNWENPVTKVTTLLNGEGV